MKKIVLVAMVLAGCTSAAQKKADEVKAQVAAQMKDPDSSKFTNLKVRLATLCGEVNSKNSFGAYAGAEKFHGASGAITMRSKAEELDRMLEGTPAAKSMGSAVEKFDRDYQECQSEGETVS